MMKIQSSAFKDHEPIPSKYTCEGQDISPPLSFSDIPKQAKSLVLIVDDPDAPSGTFDHWLVWNLPHDIHELKEGQRVPKQGTNGFGDMRYRGPCPPRGQTHRYFFKLYALNEMLDLPEGSTKQNIEDNLQGHILEKAELIGTYKR